MVSAQLSAVKFLCLLFSVDKTGARVYPHEIEPILLEQLSDRASDSSVWLFDFNNRYEIYQQTDKEIDAEKRFSEIFDDELTNLREVRAQDPEIVAIIDDKTRIGIPSSELTLWQITQILSMHTEFSSFERITITHDSLKEMLWGHVYFSGIQVIRAFHLCGNLKHLDPMLRSDFSKIRFIGAGGEYPTAFLLKPELLI